jgi:hypothetical protein
MLVCHRGKADHAAVLRDGPQQAEFLQAGLRVLFHLVLLSPLGLGFSDAQCRLQDRTVRGIALNSTPRRAILEGTNRIVGCCGKRDASLEAMRVM